MNTHNMYLIQRYMFESLIKRISISKYKENFIIKGGFLLSSIFGVDLRNTMDIDTTIKGIAINKNKLKNIIEEIIAIDINDNIIMSIEDIKDITKERIYDGYTINIIAKLDNLRTNLMIDITIGDVITYSEINYEYKTLFDDEIINIMSYNLETIISEKIDAILSKNIDNTRMKDYYDIYMFVNHKWDEINKNILVEAIKNTAQNRNTMKYINNYRYYLNLIEENQDLRKLWINYTKKYKYAEKILFDEVIKSIKILLDLLNY